jgi:dienelactone hydrolase
MIPRISLSATAAAILGALAIPGDSLLIAAMENLPTPPQVWASYDPDAGDFKEEIVSEETKNGIYRRDSYISAYVNGEEIRVYCKYAVKAGATNAPGLMNVHGWMSLPAMNEPYVKEGWAVMAHDYCGEVAGRPHFTKYPASMKYGNMDKKITPRVKDKLPDGTDITDPSQTDDYLWYAIQRRVLSYLLAQKEVDKSRIGAIGYSYGGSLMWNLAMDERVKAVVAYFGIGWNDFYRSKSVWLYDVPPKNIPKSPGEELLLSAITPEAHAPHIQAACLWLSGTNDHHGGHERSEQTFKMFQPGVPWSFALQARGKHDTNKLGNDAKLWLEKYVLGKDIDWPARPKTEIRLDAQGVPELVLTPQSLGTLEKVEGYYALKDPVSFSRFWRDANLERQGDIWVAKLPVANVDDFVFAFANLRYQGDIVISSDFTAAIPSKLGQAVATDTRAENLIDGEGLWNNVRKVEGPGGIKGIQATHNEWGIACACLSDPKWKAEKGAVLSFKFHSPEPQSVIVDAGKNFKMQIDLPASPDWQRMTIPASKLLSPGNGEPLSDWSAATTIGIKPAPEKNMTKVIFADIKWEPAVE